MKSYLDSLKCNIKNKKEFSLRERKLLFISESFFEKIAF